ncbi:acyltransferase [Paenibacillus sp. ACRRX]|uniref:acyltransferase n=1 Tax=Paenibacillus sp. ACRRX TaxID=2918206 RepID=UPI001EF67228|nr:acyltransferase [Paenibacillus sp. ACRRX]
MMSSREKLPEVQLVRAMAIIGVLSVHSTSFATLAMKDSNFYLLYNFFNVFMKIGTPTFLFLSSFVLFYSYSQRTLDKALIKSFYARRLKYIIVPYALFSVFYFVLVHFLHYRDRSLEETLGKFIVSLATGKAYTHLYFIFISIQFYVLFPIFLGLFKRKPVVAKWAVPIGLALQWGFILLNKYALQVPNKGSWSLSYMSYFMLGACLGIYYPKLKAWIVISREHATATKIAVWGMLWLTGIGAGACHMLMWYNTRLYGAAYNTLAYELAWNVHTYAAALMAFQLAHLLCRHAKPWLVQSMHRLGELSFGIYLIHPFFLLLYRSFPPEHASSRLLHFWYAGGFLFALICSWATVSLVVRVLPHAWVVFGQVPAVPRSRRAVRVVSSS